jgi:hypothetical protein
MWKPLTTMTETLTQLLMVGVVVVVVVEAGSTKDAASTKGWL